MNKNAELTKLAKELIKEGTKNIEVRGELPDLAGGFGEQVGIVITNRQAITIGKFILSTKNFPTQRDLNRLREALHILGYSVPTSNEELGNDFITYYRQLVTTVIHEGKKNGRRSNNKRS